jgi:hypothetical protein
MGGEAGKTRRNQESCTLLRLFGFELDLRIFLPLGLQSC